MLNGQATLEEMEQVWQRRKKQVDKALDHLKSLRELEESYAVGLPVSGDAKQQKPTSVSLTTDEDIAEPEVNRPWAFQFFEPKDGFPVLAESGLEAVKAVNREGFQLLVLLYGFLAVEGEHKVTGASLLKAARESGFEIKRADRELSEWEEEGSIATEGERRGKRYMLTQAGVDSVEALLEKFLSEQPSGGGEVSEYGLDSR